MLYIQIGDKVKLKSGGPTMTVYDNIHFTTLAHLATGYFKIQCHWFRNNELESGVFEANELIKVE